MAADPLRLTRRELYDRVWSEPVWTLAPTLGLSDVGLKKMCNRMHIPTPYRGYWQKKEAGQAPRRTPLPKLAASAERTLTEAVFGGPVKEAELAESVGPVADQRRHEAIIENRIVIAEALNDPHSLVAESVRALRAAKADERGFLRPKRRCLALNVSSDSVDRAMCIYDALLKALDDRGFPTSLREGDRAATVVHIRDETLSISIDEEINRIDRNPLPVTARSPWAMPEFEYVPSGRFTLRILDAWMGLRQTWADGKRQRVEDCLNDFIVGLVIVAEAIKARRLENEARDRAWRTAEERRQAEQRRRDEEASRIRAFERGVAAFQANRAAREYVTAMRGAAQDAGLLTDDSPIAAWLAWAEDYVRGTDALHPVPILPTDPQSVRRDSYLLPLMGDRSDYSTPRDRP